jgi:PAS domain S-box-containing protein
VLQLDRIPFKRAAGGEPLVADVTLTAFRGSDRRFAGWLVMARDRTADVKREADQRRRDELVRLIADGVPAAIAYIDSGLRYGFANQAFLDWGYGPGPIVGSTVREVVGEAVWAEIQPTLEAVLAGQTVRYDARRAYTDGRARYVQITYRPHLDEQGRVEGFFALLNDVTELKLAEEASRKSEELLRLVADNMPVLMSYIDHDLIYRFVSAGYRELGFPVERMVGHRVDEFITRAHFEHALPIIRRALAGEPQNYQMRWPFYADRTVDADITYLPHRDDAGRILGAFVMARDITEQLRAEEALRASEQRYRTLAESSPDMIFILDRELVVTYVNPAASKAFASVDQVGRPMAELFPAAEAERQAQSLRRVLATGEPFSREGPSTFGGRRYWLHTHLVPLRDGAGAVNAVLGIARDLTERRLVETSLAESEARFRALFEAAPFGIVLTDFATGRIERANAAFAGMLGYEPYELNGFCVLELNHPDDRAEAAATHGAVRTGRIDQYSVEKRYLARDGSAVWARLKAFLLKDEAGRVLHAVGMTEDITEQMRLRDEMQRAQKMQAIGTLAGGIAHDFNNLLTGIGGHAGFVRTQLEQQALPTEDADGILRLQRRGANLTEKLLALGRRQMIRLVPTDLNRLVHDFANLARRVIGERIELVTDLAPDLPAVLADPIQFEQVLLNLTVNARDAMPTGGTLTLVTRREEGDHGEAPLAVVQVLDTGTGIDPTIADRIFEPFFTTKEFGKGTGLGLAVAYGIVEQHRGLLRAAPRPQGGTEFRIELPSTTTAPTHAPEGPAPAPTEAFGNETILVAEDDENLRDLARRLLERRGYSVLLAADGEQAVKIFERERERIQLLLFDVAMPRKGGLEALSEIRVLDPRVRAILVSGYSDRLTAHTSEALGSPAFVRKPFSNEQLLAEVRRVLDAPDLPGDEPPA